MVQKLIWGEATRADLERDPEPLLYEARVVCDMKRTHKFENWFEIGKEEEEEGKREKVDCNVVWKKVQRPGELKARKVALVKESNAMRSKENLRFKSNLISMPISRRPMHGRVYVVSTNIGLRASCDIRLFHGVAFS